MPVRQAEGVKHTQCFRTDAVSSERKLRLGRVEPEQREKAEIIAENRGFDFPAVGTNTPDRRMKVSRVVSQRQRREGVAGAEL